MVQLSASTRKILTIFLLGTWTCTWSPLVSPDRHAPGTPGPGWDTAFLDPDKLPAVPLPPRSSQAVYEAMIETAAVDLGVEPALAKAVAHAESGFNPWAISNKGATGLMQLMPETAQRYGVANRVNPQDNVQGGVRYLKDLMRIFRSNLRLAVAAYNAGEQAVMRYGGVPPYSETRGYVKRVLHLRRQYRAQDQRS